MPLPEYLVSATMVVCERVLVETDGVPSAIRIVDTFNVPEPTPEVAGLKAGDPLPARMVIIHAFVIANIRAQVGYIQAKPQTVEIKMLNTQNEMISLAELTGQEFSAKVPGAPPAIGVVIDLNLGVRQLETATYVCFWTARK